MDGNRGRIRCLHCESEEGTRARDLSEKRRLIFILDVLGFE